MKIFIHRHNKLRIISHEMIRKYTYPDTYVNNPIIIIMCPKKMSNFFGLSAPCLSVFGKFVCINQT